MIAKQKPTRSGRSQTRANWLCELLGRDVGAELDDPLGQLGVCGLEQAAVCFEEGEHRDEREPLVAVEERLALGDAVCEHRGLECKVGALIVRVELWASSH